jgi:hypothetical protein
MSPFGETALCVSLNPRGLASLVEQALALAQHHGKRERSDLVDEASGEQRVHEFSAALRDEGRAVLLFQFCDFLCGVAQRYRDFPGQVSAFARRHVLGDPVEHLSDVVVGPP